MFKRNQKHRNQKISRKDVLKLYLNVRKKRIVFSIISCTFTIIILISILFSWYTYQNSLFTKHLNDYGNWNNDHKFSGNSDNWIGDSSKSISSTYLNDLSEYIKERINSATIDGLANKYTSLMSFETYDALGSSFHSLELFDNKTSLLLDDSLVEGRMPSNPFELVYYRENNELSFNLNDNITLFATEYYVGPKLTFKIVGIIDNLTSLFIQKQKSLDILKWEEYLDLDYLYPPEINVMAKFFSTPEFYYTIFDNFDLISSTIYTIIDFNYDNTLITPKKIPRIITNIEFMLGHGPIYYIDIYPGSKLLFSSGVGWCLDLLPMVSIYSALWIQQTIRVVAISTPLLSLLFFITLEFLNFDKTKLKNTFQKFTSYGFNLKTIKKLVIIENLLIIGISLGIGYICSLIAGPLLSISLNITLTIKIFFLVITKILIYFVLFIYLSIVFFGSYIFEMNLVRDVQIDKSKQLLNARQRISHVISKPELKLTIIGIVAVVIGIFGYLLNQTSLVLNERWIVMHKLSEKYIVYKINLAIFVSLIFVGIFIILVTIITLFSRLFTLILSKIGNIQWKIWKKKRTILNLAMKDFSSNHLDYRRLILILTLFTTCFIPGLVVKNSLTNYAYNESQLEIGCCDFRINDWQNNLTAYNSLLEIEGIESTAVITNLVFEYRMYHSILPHDYYIINILALHNVSEFINTIDFNKVNKTPNYVIKDIQNLTEENTYLISEI